ncbi:MAG TPA: helix-turn-helix transcriptional regulator [Nitrospiria bacterium]|nr:helix-turn-helix transcriptional regulator [Nitrospiria bacterium]
MQKTKVKGMMVKIALLRNNLNQTELAKRLGLTLSQVNMVINGKRKTRWIQRAIAKELRMSESDLFPTDEKGKK